MKFFYKGDIEKPHIGVAEGHKLYYCKVVQRVSNEEETVFFVRKTNKLFFGVPKPVPQGIKIILLGERPKQD